MESKQRILTEVESMFMRYGLKSVTMDDISRSLGISKKTLYQYVENKADLIQQVMLKHIEDETAAIINIHNDSKNAIDEMLKIAAYVAELLRGMSPTTLYDLKKYYRSSWDLVESLHMKQVYQIIKENLEWGKKEGLYREEIDTDILAKLYTGMSDIIVDDTLFSLSDYDRENLHGEFIRYHIHGIASKAGLKLLEKYTKTKK